MKNEKTASVAAEGLYIVDLDEFQYILDNAPIVDLTDRVDNIALFVGLS